MRSLLSLAATALAFYAPAATAADWTVDRAHSRLDYVLDIGGEQANGGFADWTAEVAFDPAAPERGRVRITVAVASATIDAPAAQGGITQVDWLAAEAFPEAVFTGEGFTLSEDGRYSLPGTLTLKGVSRPLVLSGTLSVEGRRAFATVEAVVERGAHDIGPPDPAVSPKVAIRAEIIARIAE
jgi:polyisoprenoid-binding protein YceI